MPDIIEFLKRVSSLNYEDTLFKVWSDKRVQSKIIELNTEEQLFKKGVDSDNVTLGYYSPVSVEKYGKPEGHIRLYDSGEFFESFRILVFGTIAEIVADTMKEDTDLTKKYGKEIIGLTDESKKVLKEIISIVIKEILRRDLSTS